MTDDLVIFYLGYLVGVLGTFTILFIWPQLWTKDDYYADD